MKRLLLAAALCLTLSGCAGLSAPTSEYTVDSSVYTLLTAEKMVLSRPCTATVKVACVDKALAQRLKDSRIALMGSLHTYQDARDAYLAGGDEAPVQAAYTAFASALTAAKNIIATPSVQAILEKTKEKP